MNYQKLCTAIDELLDQDADLCDILLVLSSVCKEDYPKACLLLVDARAVALNE